MPKFRSQGQMRNIKELKRAGDNVVIEEGAKIINPHNVLIGSNVYIGHNSVLNAYLKNTLEIGDNVWIGANSYLHSAGGIKIESNVGIGPGVKIVSSVHDLKRDDLGPINSLPLRFAPIVIKTGSDIGTGAVIMPGVTIGEGTQVGAGAVVTHDTKKYSIVVGIPARQIAVRQNTFETQMKIKIETLSQLSLEKNLKTILTINKTEGRFLEKWSADNFLRALPLKFQLSVISWHEKSIVGWAIVSKKDDTCRIHRIVVAGDYSNQGIGSEMIRAIEQRARVKKINRLSAEALKNKKLINFYQKNGFQKLNYVLQKKYSLKKDIAVRENFLKKYLIFIKNL